MCCGIFILLYMCCTVIREEEFILNLIQPSNIFPDPCIKICDQQQLNEETDDLLAGHVLTFF